MTDQVAAAELRNFVERYEQLEAEKKEIERAKNELPEEDTEAIIEKMLDTEEELVVE